MALSAAVPSSVEHTPSVTAPGRFYISSLDGIRAVAFAMVFVSHIRGKTGGMFGVTVFFFLSGYLITTLLRRENDRSGSVSILRFYARRIVRIMPPFYLTIGFFVGLIALGVLSVPPMGHGMILAFSSFLGNYWLVAGKPSNPAFGPLWSLAVEEHFYLVFPFLFVLLCKARISYRTQAAILGGITVFVLALRIVVASHPSQNATLHILYGTDTRIDSILFGCIMALAFNPVMGDTSKRPPVWLMAAGVLGLILSVAMQGAFYRNTFHYTLQGLAMIPVFLGVIGWGQSWFAFLNWKAVRFVGTLSYTLYLVHRGMILLARQYLHSTSSSTAAALMGSLLFALLMNRLVERPLISVRKKLANHSERQQKVLAGENQSA